MEYTQLPTLIAVAEEEKPKRVRKRSKYLCPPYIALGRRSRRRCFATSTRLEEQEEEKEEVQELLLLHLHKASVSTADLFSAFLQSAASTCTSSDVVDDVLLRFFTLYRTSVIAKVEDAVADGPQDALEAEDKRKNVTFQPKKKKESTVHGLYYGIPVALVLDFTPYTIHLPSKEELLAAFCMFGFLIESETGIDRDARRARVVFGSNAEAETAYRCAETLGTFGPPFATPSLQHMPPIKLDDRRPAPKLPLTEMRKNLEKMILSLTSRSSSSSKDEARNLAREMQVLLAEVNKLLSAGPSTTTAHNN